MIKKLIEKSKSIPKRSEADGLLHEILAYLNCVGLMVVPSVKYVHEIKPIIDKEHWTEEEWQRERKYLVPYKDDMIGLLREL